MRCIPCQSLCKKIFFPFCGLSFCFVNGFLLCAKAFKFNQVPFAYFCSHYSMWQIQKDIAATYVKGCSMFPSKNFIVLSYMYIFNSLCIYFCVCCQSVFQFHSPQTSLRKMPLPSLPPPAPTRLFFATPMACRSSRARDQTCATAVTQATAVTTLDP